MRVDATNGSLAFVLDRPDHYALRVAGRRFYFWVDPLAALARPAGAASYDASGAPATGSRGPSTPAPWPSRRASTARPRS